MEDTIYQSRITILLSLDIDMAFLSVRLFVYLSVRPCLSIDACTVSLLAISSFWLFPTCRTLQPPTSSFSCIIVVTDSSNTTHYSRRQCLFGDRKPFLEQFAARHHISSDSRCLPESTLNLPVLSFVHALTDTYATFSGLAVLTACLSFIRNTHDIWLAVDIEARHRCLPAESDFSLVILLSSSSVEQFIIWVH